VSGNIIVSTHKYQYQNINSGDIIMSESWYQRNREHALELSREKRANNPRVIEKKVRQKARDAGQKTYQSTIPCKRGHTERRSTNGNCVECQRISGRKHHYSNHGHKAMILKNARNRAKAKGIPFTITEEDIVIPEVCPVLGIPLERGDQKDFAYNSPSLDRIVPELGYVPGNVIVMSNKANRMKSDGTKEDIIALYEWAIANL
jgi:hypothetical protein